MISPTDRLRVVALIDGAVAQGARRALACKEAGLCRRTWRRWVTANGTVRADARPDTIRAVPAHALTAIERAHIIATACTPEFASLPPSQIVPILADRGQYIASESSFYRVLRAHALQQHRGRSHVPSASQPERHHASGPNQVWVWDITWIPGPIQGSYHYLYMVLDLFSRKVVGWEVHDAQTAEHAAQVMTCASLKEGRAMTPLVLHSDNGSPMKGATMLATLQRLGIMPSFSRPGVSDDNAQAEAFFRTLKYRPGYPAKGFATLAEAQLWVHDFMQWYNTEHRHSALNFVTPQQRHEGADAAVFAQRKSVYAAARLAQPARWHGATRNWKKPGPVWLNPPPTTQLSTKTAN